MLFSLEKVEVGIIRHDTQRIGGELGTDLNWFFFFVHRSFDFFTKLFNPIQGPCATQQLTD